MSQSPSPRDGHHDRPFLEAILAAPGDAAPRLIYADYLLDRGDEEDLLQQALRLAEPRGAPGAFVAYLPGLGPVRLEVGADTLRTWPGAAVLSRTVANSLGVAFRVIPAGTFLMGWLSDEAKEG